MPLQPASLGSARARTFPGLVFLLVGNVWLIVIISQEATIGLQNEPYTLCNYSCKSKTQLKCEVKAECMLHELK